MNKPQSPLIRAWQWWFTPRTSDPTVRFRERALRALLLIILLLRPLNILRNYSGEPGLFTPSVPLWVSLAFSIIPILLSFYFLACHKVGLAGTFFVLHWYFADLLSLQTEGYWYPGYQISLIMQIILGALLLPSRFILLFWVIQVVTVGAWGNWLDASFYDPPLLASGQPVAVFWMSMLTLASQELIILLVVRYLRIETEKALRMQQVTIQQLQTEVEERQQAESARQRLEGLYRRAIEAAGAVPYVFDPATRTLRFLGDGILSMTGYPASELMSYDQWSKVEQMGFPRGKLAHLTYDEADRLTDEDDSIPWECDFRIRTRDGQTRWIADTSVKGFDETGEHIVAVGLKQDITERKRVEEEIKQLNLELEQRVRARTTELEAANKELEAFSYSVSHDLRAPLRAINGFARILAADFSAELGPVGLDVLQKILAAGDKMGRLINDLLDFSRLGRKSLNKQIVAVESIVHSVIESLAPETAGRQIEWVLPALPSTAADPALLQQIYANLIGNAVKYSRLCETARIEIGSINQKGETVYFVRDNGAGFDMQYADKLYGVFQRLHREDEFEGTGIGLATVQRIIQRHGGRIWAEAEVNKGATFYFTLE